MQVNYIARQNRIFNHILWMSINSWYSCEENAVWSCWPHEHERSRCSPAWATSEMFCCCCFLTKGRGNKARNILLIYIINHIIFNEIFCYNTSIRLHLWFKKVIYIWPLIGVYSQLMLCCKGPVKGQVNKYGNSSKQNIVL